MAKDTGPKSPRSQAQTREDRLKAALKSNMGRRKAQARARSGAQSDATNTNGGTTSAQKGE